MAKCEISGCGQPTNTSVHDYGSIFIEEGRELHLPEERTHWLCEKHLRLPRTDSRGPLVWKGGRP